MCCRNQVSKDFGSDLHWVEIKVSDGATVSSKAQEAHFPSWWLLAESSLLWLQVEGPQILKAAQCSLPCGSLHKMAICFFMVSRSASPVAWNSFPHGQQKFVIVATNWLPCVCVGSAHAQRVRVIQRGCRVVHRHTAGWESWNPFRILPATLSVYRSLWEQEGQSGVFDASYECSEAQLSI